MRTHCVRNYIDLKKVSLYGGVSDIFPQESVKGGVVIKTFRRKKILSIIIVEKTLDKKVCNGTQYDHIATPLQIGQERLICISEDILKKQYKKLRKEKARLFAWLKNRCL